MDHLSGEDVTGLLAGVGEQPPSTQTLKYQQGLQTCMASRDAGKTEDAQHRRLEQKKRGKAAELCVRAILNELPKGTFRVFNDVKTRYGNIDHLVVSREGGVFLVETKAHRGKVATDGKTLLLNGSAFRKSFIAQVNRNIKWLRERYETTCGIRPWIVAVIVFTEAGLWSAEGKAVPRLPPVKRVHVVRKEELKTLIINRSPLTRHGGSWDRAALFDAITDGQAGDGQAA